MIIIIVIINKVIIHILLILILSHIPISSRRHMNGETGMISFLLLSQLSFPPFRREKKSTHGLRFLFYLYIYVI